MSTAPDPMLATSTRISFFDAQARERAAASRWRVLLSALGLLLLATASLLLSPPFTALVALASLIVGGPDIYALLEAALVQLFWLQWPDPVGGALLVALGLGPGLVLAGLALWRLEWLAARTHEAVAARLLRLREPRRGDFEEMQLRNTIEEMAIAAGCPPPTLRLIDARSVNLAVITVRGRSTLIVTRGLVDVLPRAETQSLAALAIATLCHDDGRIADRWLRLGELAGLVCALSHAAYSSEARALLRPLFARDDEAGVDALIALRRVLANPLSLRLDPVKPRVTPRDVLLFPLLGLHLVGLAVVPLTWQILVETAVGKVFQRRRLLGDAGAVRFQRQPDALARIYAGLDTLDTRVPEVEKAPWLANLFLLNPTSARELFSPFPTPRARLRRVLEQGGQVDAPLATASVGKGRKRKKPGAHPADRLEDEPLARRIAAFVFLALVFAMLSGFIGTFIAASWAFSQLCLRMPVALVAWLLGAS